MLLILKNKNKYFLAYCSSIIFNSTYNFFKFLEKNSQDKERLNYTIRKTIFEIISKYIKLRREFIFDYLQMIRVNF